MEIGKTLYAKDRVAWRSWLAKNHNKQDEIWLINYKKHTGKPSIPYNDAVEEALCFGWIDSILKRVDDARTVQRYTPRRDKSKLSEMNKERIRRLVSQGLMTEAGMSKVRHLMDERFSIPADITMALRSDPEVWSNFQRFPESYKKIRIGWIETARKRPEVFKTRLDYFMKMTGINKMYGKVQ